MAQITMDKKALAILGVILAFLGLALFAAGLFSGILLREAGSRPDAGAIERQLAEVNSRLERASCKEDTAPAPAPAPAPEPAKAAPAAPPPPPPPPASAGYVVQSGAFTVKLNAVNQAERLKERGLAPAVVEVKDTNDRIWFVVRVPGFASLEEAQKAAEMLLLREGIKAVAMEADFPMAPLRDQVADAEPAPAKRKAAAEPAPKPSGKLRYSVQVSSFRDEEDADTTMRMLKNRGYTPCVVTLYDDQEKPWFVVQIGDFATSEEASRAGAAYKGSGGSSYVVKSYDDNFLAQRRRCK